MEAKKFTTLEGRTLLRRVFSWTLKCELDLLQHKCRSGHSKQKEERAQMPGGEKAQGYPVMRH